MKKIITYAFVPFTLAALMVTIALSPLACHPSKPCTPTDVGCIIEGALADCTGVTSVESGVTVAEPIVVGLINSATAADGSISWAGIEGQLISIALQYGPCVLAEIWDGLFGAGGSGSGSGSGSSVPGKPALARAQLKANLNTASAKAEFDRIRAKVAPGYSFKLRSGGTL